MQFSCITIKVDDDAVIDTFLGITKRRPQASVVCQTWFLSGNTLPCEA